MSGLFKIIKLTGGNIHMNELTSQEMLEINGGVDGDTIVAGGTIVGMATSAAIGFGGKTIMSMGVAAYLSWDQ